MYNLYSLLKKINTSLKGGKYLNPFTVPVYLAHNMASW